MAQTFDVGLRREDNSQPWGFRLRGGSDQGMPLHVEHVNPKGRAAHQGLQAGDMILAICRSPMQGKTHQQVKQEMLRAGNELDLTIQRESGGVPSAQVARPPDNVVQAPPRSQVVEEPTAKLGGAKFKDVTPKTYQVLQNELPQCEQEGARPASIFERKRQERSGYLQAKGPTIQKAFGES